MLRHASGVIDDQLDVGRGADQSRGENCRKGDRDGRDPTMHLAQHFGTSPVRQPMALYENLVEKRN
jgi:hypothetical protein